MNWLHYLASFFAGAFLCNAIPHLTAGLRGEPFPSPFAKPIGVGDSPPLVNFLWGTANLMVSLVLFRCAQFTLGMNLECALFAVGFIGMGIQLSLHFGKVWRDKKR